MRYLAWPGLLGVSVLGLALWSCAAREDKGSPAATARPERLYAELEAKLTPLSTKLGPPRPGEWLHQHKEAGQTFDEYLKAEPVRRSQRWNKVYLLLLGEF